MVFVLKTKLKKHFVSAIATKCAEQVVKHKTTDK